MGELGCCKRAGQRTYYWIFTVVYGITLVIELVSLGTFGVQFSRTRSQFGSDACVLFGKERDEVGSNASCGFTLWAMTTVVLVLLIWTLVHIVMALIGRPKITSLFRIIDLIMVSLMAFLSLIISSVVTDGLAKTCSNSGSPETEPCINKKLNGETFFGTLNAAQDTSWTVTIIFVILIGWYVMMLVIHCCKAKYQKEEDLEAAAKSRKEGGETDSEEKPFTDKSNDDEMSD